MILMFNNLIYIKYNVLSIRNQTWSGKGRLSEDYEGVLQVTN